MAKVARKPIKVTQREAFKKLSPRAQKRYAKKAIKADLRGKMIKQDATVTAAKERRATRRDVALGVVGLGSQKIQADRDVKIKLADAQIEATKLANAGNPVTVDGAQSAPSGPTNPWGW